MLGRIVKEIVRRFIYEIFSFLNIFIPKKNQIFIYAGEVLSDNNEAFFRYLVENTMENFFCIANKHLQYKKGRYHFKKNNVINALFLILTSKIVIDDHMHQIKARPAKNQLILNLWHGNPLKKLFSTPLNNNGSYYSKIFYGAEIFKDSMMASFGCCEKKMFLSGLQRNDYLKIKPLNGEKKIFWLPTYRQWGAIKLTSDALPIVSKENVEQLNSFLKEKKITLFIKPHPLQSKELASFLTQDFDYINLISDEDIFRLNKPLYVFLAEMNALLTDYSSVFFDFLLLNRPIGFTIDDYKEYEKNVGFSVNAPLDLMPGHHIKNFDALIRFIDDVANGTDCYVEKRLEVNKLVNYSHSLNNCEETYSLIKEFMYHGKK